MLFELRFYSVAQGRIDAEIARIHDVAIAGAPAVVGGPPVHAESLWDRYNIPRPIGAWTVTAGPRTPGLLFILKWNDLKHRDSAYPRFWNDPYWLAIRAKGADGSPLVDSIEDWIMGPSAVWPRVWDESDAPAGPVQEMIVQHVPTGTQSDANEALASVDLARARAHGARVTGIFEIALGPSRPSYIIFLSWPDFATQQRARAALDVDAQILEQRAREGIAHARQVFGKADRYLLQSIPWGHPAANFGIGKSDVQPLTHHGGGKPGVVKA